MMLVTIPDRAPARNVLTATAVLVAEGDDEDDDGGAAACDAMVLLLSIPFL